MPITVRPADVADAAAIAAINLASWEAAYRGIVADAFLDGALLSERTARWQQLIATAGPVLVAAAGDAVVGYCSLALPARDDDADSATAEIAAIYVTPERFRAGIGSALLQGALELMRDRAFHTATLWVLSENQRARAFYARHGFTPDGAVQWLERLAAEELRLRRPL